MADSAERVCARCGTRTAVHATLCAACSQSVGDPFEAQTWRADVEAGPRSSPHCGDWGPFRLIEKVGEGSFGEVYRAFDTTLERDVALKLLLPRFSDTRDQTAAVLREARLLARVRHSNVVPVYGVDTHEGRVGFWSEFVRGKTLTSLLAAQGRFGAKEAQLIAIDVCKATSAVHAAGLLHRDIKAGNVMREEGGRILLMDFGLSLDHNENQPMGGTPAYMAPELFLGGTPSVESDIYAIGVLLFHLLTAKYPTDIDSTQPRSIYEERGDVPDSIARTIQIALDPDPKRRFSNAGQMIAALSETTVEESAQKRAAMRIWVFVAVALMIVAALLVLRRPNSTQSASVRSDYLKAEDLLEHYYKPNAIDSAVSLLQKAAMEDPNSAANHAGLCRALWWHYRDKKDQTAVEPARNECARALEIDPDMASAHVTLGMIYTTTGRVELGEEELKKALALDSRSADAWSARAELYQKQGRTAEIEPAIQKASDLKPDAWRYLNQLGVYYLGTGRNAAAVDQFRRASQLNPDNARALNNLGLALSNLDRNDEAREAFEKSIGIDPQYSTFENLGAVDWAVGKVNDAAKAFAQATRINPASYIGWANLAAAQNQIAEEKGKARETYLKAIKIAEKARANAPSDATIVSDLATYYASVGMAEKSRPLLRQASALNPDDPQVLYRVAQGYELLQERGEALKWIAKAFNKGMSRTIVERDPELASLRKDPQFPRSDTGKLR